MCKFLTVLSTIFFTLIMFEHQLFYFSLEISIYSLSPKQTNKKMCLLLFMYIKKSLFSVLIDLMNQRYLKIQTFNYLAVHWNIQVILNCSVHYTEGENTVTLSRQLTFLSVADQVTMEILFTASIALGGTACKGWTCRVYCLSSNTGHF